MPSFADARTTNLGTLRDTSIVTKSRFKHVTRPRVEFFRITAPRYKVFHFTVSPMRVENAIYDEGVGLVDLLHFGLVNVASDSFTVVIF
jgi:hypothetical protein